MKCKRYWNLNSTLISMIFKMAKLLTIVSLDFIYFSVATICVL